MSTPTGSTAEERFGHVDAVVHAAGRMPLSTVADLDVDSTGRNRQVVDDLLTPGSAL